jgi:hypothetical protein
MSGPDKKVNPMLRKIQTTGANAISVDKENDLSDNPFKKASTEIGGISILKFPTSVETYEVNHYLTTIEPEIKSVGLTYDQRCYVEQIAENLDKINKSVFCIFILNIKDEKFNRLILDHIVEYGGFKYDQPILLKDFFRIYFVVYENMKQNRIDLAKECQELKKEIDNSINEVQKHQKTEQIQENGLTNNSELQVIPIKVDKNLLDLNLVIIVSIIGEGTIKEINLVEECLNKKFNM